MKSALHLWCDTCLTMLLLSVLVCFNRLWNSLFKNDNFQYQKPLFFFLVCDNVLG